jgi:glycosyltransferase involved in cell wall biosynthesis
MTWSLNCAAVIPCFDEAATIAGLVGRLRITLPTVVVVDDGSSDGTAAAAAAAGGQVLRHERNRGKGAALRTGCHRAWEEGFRWALLLDGDGQHAPADVPAFFDAAESSGATLLVGNRMGQATAMPWLRRAVNRWMSQQLSRRAGLRLPDSQCGFRLIRLDTWVTLPLRANRFEIESEMLLAVLAAGHKVEFVPIQVLPSLRPSRIHPVLDAWRWWRWWRGGLAAGAAAAMRPGITVASGPAA